MELRTGMVKECTTEINNKDMGTSIAHTSKELVSRLIRTEFDNCEWWNEKSQLLIQTAKDYGLTELAAEMENDLKAA